MNAASSAGSTLFLLTVLLTATTVRSLGQPGKENVEGKKMYKKYQCESCHGKDGRQPFDLTRAFQKYDDEKMKMYIMNPRGFGNPRMPVFETLIKEEDYHILIRYVIELGKQSKS